MLVDVSKSEQEVLNSIRKSEKYKKGDFEKYYVETTVEIRRIVEAAKIYILDNYQKVDDYTNLHLMLRCSNHEGTCYFGKKSRGDKKGGMTSKIFEKILKELDDKTVEIKSFDQAVYDWTDGDFSVVFNEISYNWIDTTSIIDIASHIERKLSKG